MPSSGTEVFLSLFRKRTYDSLHFCQFIAAPQNMHKLIVALSPRTQFFAVPLRLCAS
jgi:hypothetical protein